MKTEQIRKIIGQRIKHYRKIHSLTQKQLSARIGAVSTTYITNVEAGQKGISLEKIYEICEFFNINVSDLLPIETKDDEDEKEKVVLETADLLRGLEISQVRMFKTMIAGVCFDG
ncbi:MAG: helix-turn-helix domain-containing protein [Oscillospiraceae bacterium]|nr:helix-turn-helix domain-containing protein [Oscillospiraceae bacterium]